MLIILHSNAQPYALWEHSGSIVQLVQNVRHNVLLIHMPLIVIEYVWLIVELVSSATRSRLNVMTVQWIVLTDITETQSAICVWNLRIVKLWMVIITTLTMIPKCVFKNAWYLTTGTMLHGCVCWDATIRPTVRTQQEFVWWRVVVDNFCLLLMLSWICVWMCVLKALFLPMRRIRLIHVLCLRIVLWVCMQKIQRRVVCFTVLMITVLFHFLTISRRKDVWILVLMFTMGRLLQDMEFVLHLVLVPTISGTIELNNVPMSVLTPIPHQANLLLLVTVPLIYVWLSVLRVGMLKVRSIGLVWRCVWMELGAIRLPEFALLHLLRNVQAILGLIILRIFVRVFVVLILPIVKYFMDKIIRGCVFLPVLRLVMLTPWQGYASIYAHTQYQTPRAFSVTQALLQLVCV